MKTPRFKIIAQAFDVDEVARLASRWQAAQPFPVLVIDDFADDERLRRVAAAFPEPAELKRSRDFVFAKNKFEKNDFRGLSPEMSDLYDDLTSPAFAEVLGRIVGHEVFVDPGSHGGGLHMGGESSFLDMHVDFNVHPLHSTWLRELNILLYLNEGWMPDWRGSLKLRNAETGATSEIEPLFNRCVIMLTKGHTLHGYDQISFPPDRMRKSVATYAYRLLESDHQVTALTTVWKSELSPWRNRLGVVMPTMVKWKNRLFGSGSTRNR